MVFYTEGGEFPDKCQLVVPAHLQQKIMDEHHDSSFAGCSSMKQNE